MFLENIRIPYVPTIPAFWIQSHGEKFIWTIPGENAIEAAVGSEETEVAHSLL